MSEDLRFPIGEFNSDFEVTRELRNSFVETISELPEVLKEAVDWLSEEQIDTQYRPEGWTVRQVVHHIADSHLNSYCRFKLALTEDFPTIRGYHEDRWAELPDSEFNRFDSNDNYRRNHLKFRIFNRIILLVCLYNHLYC